MAEGPAPVGAICYLEIPAPDMEKARRFYSTVFRWRILDEGIAPPAEPEALQGTPVVAGTSYLAFDDGRVGGGLNPALAPADRQGINLVLKVERIPETLAEIARAGGTVVKERTEVGGGQGFYALFRDPNGNLLSIWARE